MSTLEEPAALRGRAGSSPRRRAGAARLVSIASAGTWTICLITVAAAALRFTSLSGVSPNAFYDAAVRSMSLSWHNFFFGAYDPAGILSIDKPPLDLWLQVLSVKLLGFNQFALKLPEALAGTLSVPLLYDAVRRAVGRPAGLAAAAALAVLPESVLTSRSDTMDSVMMLLVIAALWLTISAARSGRRRPIVLAGVVLGVAFNIKLLQALLPAPALIVLYLLARRASARAKLKDLLLSGTAAVGVGLSWAIVASLAPGRHPWPVGSSDGTVWNAMFVFNGIGKVSSSATSSKTGGPGLFRLVVPTDWHYDLLFGCVLVAAVTIGIAGAITTRRRTPATRRRTPATSRRTDAPVPAQARGPAPDQRLARALAISLAVWIGLAVIVFDVMVTVHARYLEALAPALAAAIGFGAAAIAGLHRASAATPSLRVTILALFCVCAYSLHFNPPSIAWGAAALIVATAGAVLIARAPGVLGDAGKWLTAGLIVTCVLLFPVHESLLLVRTRANDSLGLAIAPVANTAALSRYLEPRTIGLRYELAVDEPLKLAPLVISDQRPILPITSFAGRPLLAVERLRADVRAGRVRYGLVDLHRCDVRGGSRWAACAPAARWIRRNGFDVTAAVGLSGPSRLYLLSPARAA